MSDIIPLNFKLVDTITSIGGEWFYDDETPRRMASYAWHRQKTAAAFVAENIDEIHGARGFNATLDDSARIVLARHAPSSIVHAHLHEGIIERNISRVRHAVANIRTALSRWFDPTLAAVIIEGAPVASFTLTPPVPRVVDEQIWALTGDATWTRARIISRGGPAPFRLIVEWNDEEWLAEETPDGIRIEATYPYKYPTPKFYSDDARVKAEANEAKRAKARQRRSEDTDRWFDRISAKYAQKASATDIALLGLPSTFTKADVQRAFKQKSFKAHPDLGGDPDFFRALVAARDALLASAEDAS